MSYRYCPNCGFQLIPFSTGANPPPTSQITEANYQEAVKRAEECSWRKKTDRELRKHYPVVCTCEDSPYEELNKNRDRYSLWQCGRCKKPSSGFYDRETGELPKPQNIPMPSVENRVGEGVDVVEELCGDGDLTPNLKSCCGKTMTVETSTNYATKNWFLKHLDRCKPDKSDWKTKKFDIHEEPSCQWPDDFKAFVHEVHRDYYTKEEIDERMKEVSDILFQHVSRFPFRERKLQYDLIDLFRSQFLS